MRFIVTTAVAVVCLVLPSSSALAQGTLHIAPTSYTIGRFPGVDVVDIVAPAPATLSGGDTVTINVRLPQPLGIDLSLASTFTTFMI